MLKYLYKFKLLFNIIKYKFNIKEVIYLSLIVKIKEIYINPYKLSIIFK